MFGLEQRSAAVARLDAALKVCASSGPADVRELSDLRDELAKN